MKSPKTTTSLTARLLFAVAVIIAASSSIAEGQTKSAKPRALYEAGQMMLTNEQYREASKNFERLFRKHQDSKYVGDALYWYAFALHRLGGRSNLRNASEALERQMDQYGDTETRDDASALYYRVLGERARNGDEKAARKLEEARDGLGTLSDNMGTKLMAMEALINMSAGRALPILKLVMSDRTPASAVLREKAVFLLAQNDTDESFEMLVDSAKNDPNRKVREQAIFWLSQVDSEAAVDFLEELATRSDDLAIRKKAIFALSQHDTDRSAKILRKIALDTRADVSIREQSIFWLGQAGNNEDTEFLIGLYKQLDNETLKEKVIFSVSQNDDNVGTKWLIAMVKDTGESIQMRKKALFWAGQSDLVGVKELVDLYKSDPETDFREQVIFVLSQRSERVAFDALLELAGHEKDRNLLKKLIFWIGQSDDPRAADFLMNIIEK